MTRFEGGRMGGIIIPREYSYKLTNPKFDPYFYAGLLFTKLNEQQPDEEFEVIEESDRKYGALASFFYYCGIRRYQRIALIRPDLIVPEILLEFFGLKKCSSLIFSAWETYHGTFPEKELEGLLLKTEGKNLKLSIEDRRHYPHELTGKNLLSSDSNIS